MTDFVKDPATRAAMDVAEGDWMGNPFRYFRGVVFDKTFSSPVSCVDLFVNLPFKPELLIPLMVLPSTSSLTIHADKFTIGKAVISLSNPGRLVALIGRFDAQVTGQGVR